jgi:hypothetical protein
MTSNPDDRTPEPEDDSRKAGAELGLDEEGTTFEPEEDPEGAG